MRVLVPFQASQQLIVNEGNLYLLQNMCMVHLKSDNIEALSAAGIQTDIIPAGYTQCLLVMDKGVNKPFKQYLRTEATQWLLQQPANTKPSRQVVVQWIHTAWGKVTVETIANTWASIVIIPFTE